ncbi:efflux RND transporter periplasmic adaptor subunit [Taibaiella sp. KBW10]|nr:efflux RND transporter periplasmic adaptor subunit [Taibaiella sp. KBW10]
MNNTFHAALLAGLFIALSSCQHDQKENKADDFVLRGDTICILPNTNLSKKLKIGSVQNEPYRLQMLTAGTVKAIPTQYAEIAPPFPGRVTRSYLRLGMKTTPETPLFEISAPDFITAQKIFFQEKSQLEQAKKNWQRQQDLVAHGVGTQKDLEEAQTAYEVEKKEYENAVIGIKIFKADPNRLSLGQALVVRAPISGEVVENKVVLGQFIKDDAASVATVAELSKIWIVAQVKEKDIRFIHELDECTIEIAALPEQPIKGKVYHVNEIVDEATRSVEVLIEADNKNHTLKPGMYVTVNFIDAPTTAILIPAKAVLQMADASFVFLETASGKYIKRKIETAGTSGDKVVVKSGLNTGERIVTEGGFYLLDAR